MKLSRNYESSLDPEVFVWFSSQTDLNLVDLIDMSMLQIKGFLPESKDRKKPIPLLAATVEHGKYVAIIFLLLDVFGVAYLNPKIKEPTDYLLSELVPKGRRVGDQATRPCVWTGSRRPRPQKPSGWAIWCSGAVASTPRTALSAPVSPPSGRIRIWAENFISSFQTKL